MMFRNRKKTGKEFISPGQEMRENSRITVKDLLGGSVFSRETVIRQIPFFLFVGLLLLIYIGNQYRGEKIMKQVTALEKRIKELKTESAYTTFKLQEIGTQSKVLEAVVEKGLELEEATVPPKIITIKD